MYCIVCYYAGPIEEKGKDKTPFHNKHEERLYSSENQHSGITGLVRQRYHDSTSRVPSKGILLNVYRIKDKP